MFNVQGTKFKSRKRQVKKPRRRFDKLSVNGTVQHRACSSELRRRLSETFARV
jgi:hypothetical protein